MKGYTMPATASPHHVAAVDIGSNTLHLIVATIDPEDQHLTIRARQVDLIRLGADVAATGAIGPERAARAEAALRAMAAIAKQHGATLRIGMATEGVRAASNASEILARFGAAWGAPITLLSGLEEAALTFWGATSAVANPQDRLAIGDLGGGSCELVVGDGGKIVWAQSLPLGSGRLMAAVAPSDPPTPADLAALTAQSEAALAHVAIPPPPAHHLIAVGGTANSIARVLHSASPVLLDDGLALTVTDIDDTIAILAAAPSATIAANSQIEVERAKILVGGTIAWRAIMQRLGLAVMTVSQRGVREGAIIAWQQAGEQWQTYARQSVPATPEKP